MMISRIVIEPLMVLLAFVTNGATPVVDDEIELKAVPAKVMAAVKTKFPNAVLKKAFKEVEDGKTMFEIEATESEKGLDLAVTPEGVITEVERELDPKALAEPILAAIAAKFPGSTIKGAESVETLKDGNTVKTIEATVIDKDKETYEVVLSPEGKILKSEEVDDDDDDKEKDDDEKK